LVCCHSFIILKKAAVITLIMRLSAEHETDNYDIILSRAFFHFRTEQNAIMVNV